MHHLLPLVHGALNLNATVSLVVDRTVLYLLILLGHLSPNEHILDCRSSFL